MNRTIGFTITFLLMLVMGQGAPAGEAPTSITVTVPDYEVERAGEFDEVLIPGGGQLLVEEGRPLVPYYNTVVEYPKGYRIQEVLLTDKSKAKTDSGLRLATVELSSYAERQLTRPKPLNQGVYPTTDYGWEAMYAHDGSATLVISVFPFFYDPATTRSTFYRNYSFDIRHIKTRVEITSVEPTKTTYEPGDKARLVLKLANEGSAQDVVASATVRKAFTLERVADIPAKTVSGLGKADSVLLEWPTKRRATGGYAVEVIIRDRSDNRLDQEWASFRIGTPEGEVSEFSVTPQHFEVGDDIRLRLGFKNTGSCGLKGSCVFRVMRDGDVVDELRQGMSLLKPGASKTFTQTWNTKDAKKSSAYYAVGYVEFEGMACRPKSARFSTNLLPAARFEFSPDTASVGEEFRFDATASADEDGTIERFLWEFDDGGKATDSIAAYAYLLPGDYNVTLTVTDNEGGTDSSSRVVTVTE